MADERRRRDPPAHPELREGVFGDHDERELHRGRLEPRVGRRLGALLGEPDGADVVVELGAEDIEAPIHPFAEHRLGIVEIAGHVRVLRPAAGEHEDRVGTVADLRMSIDPARVSLPEKPRGLFGRLGHHHPAVLEGAAPVPSPVSQSASRTEAWSRAAFERAESVSSWNGQSLSSEGCAAGASSSTACALVPPTPSEFTPARRGWPVSSHGVSAAFTSKGEFSKSIAGFGASKLSEAGSALWCSASDAFTKLATPAAVSRWPILVFTDPIRQGPSRPAPLPKTSVSAATSIGSPR